MSNWVKFSKNVNRVYDFKREKKEAFFFVFSLLDGNKIEQNRTEHGWKITGGLRLPFQGRLDRRLRCWQVQSSFPIHTQRFLSGVQVHHRRRVRHSNCKGPFFLLILLLPFLSPGNLVFSFSFLG